MPTKNPRITITLPPALHVQLQRLSELTGNSQSGIVSELLEQSMPVFARLIEVLEAAKEAKQEMSTKLADNLAEAQARMEQQLGLAMETFDAHTGDLIAEAEAIKRRARKQSTPMSNRGVRSTPRTPKGNKKGSR